MKGEQPAKSANLVRAELRKQGITPTVVKAKPKPLFGGAGKRITPKDIAVFSRQIATMMKSGVPIVTVAGDHRRRPEEPEDAGHGQRDPRRHRERLVAVTRRWASTRCSSTSCTATWSRPANRPACWTPCSTRSPPTRKTSRALKGKIKKAMFYPAMVVAVAILVSAILLVFVVPQFEEVFQSFGADLPAFTQMIIGRQRFHGRAGGG